MNIFLFIDWLKVLHVTKNSPTILLQAVNSTSKPRLAVYSTFASRI